MIFLFLTIFNSPSSDARSSQFNSLKSKQKLAPQPPTVPGATQSGPADTGQASKSNVMWPVGTIPRRVKKLSWDDEGDAASFQRKVKINVIN